jgi:hypothetical protein
VTNQLYFIISSIHFYSKLKDKITLLPLKMKDHDEYKIFSTIASFNEQVSLSEEMIMNVKLSESI